MSAFYAESQEHWSGRVIAGKYRLDSLLGEGGMGSVWRAFNLQLEVPVALKLLRAGLSGEGFGERLRLEARAAAKLVHPSIVRVFDIGETEAGEPFIVMELLSGESLGEALARGPIPPTEALQLLLPVAEGLSLAHSHGVVHRDLKPDNVFLAKDPLGADSGCVHPKLLDFGIAKVTDDHARGATLIDGTLIGSPEYMSPEQACGRNDIDQRSDVWAFCVVLYELLSGAPPFTGNTWQEILHGVMLDEPAPLSALPGVDDALFSVISRGLAKDREQRPASLLILGQLLAGWLEERGVHHDITGASLVSKWLSRASDGVIPLCSPPPSAPKASRERSTLISVVHPEPGSSKPPAGKPPRRANHWLPALAVTTAALGAGLLGLSLNSEPYLWATRSGSTAAESVRIEPVARPVVTIAAQLAPANPPSDDRALASEPSEPPPAAHALAAPTPHRFKAAGPAGNQGSHRQVAARPSALSKAQQSDATREAIGLPQALPRRDPEPALLEPY